MSFGPRNPQSRGELFLNRYDLGKDPVQLPLMALALHGVYGFKPAGNRRITRFWDASEMKFGTPAGWGLTYKGLRFTGTLEEALAKAESIGFLREPSLKQRMANDTLWGPGWFLKQETERKVILEKPCPFTTVGETSTYCP